MFCQILFSFEVSKLLQLSVCVPVSVVWLLMCVYATTLSAGTATLRCVGLPRSSCSWLWSRVAPVRCSMAAETHWRDSSLPPYSSPLMQQLNQGTVVGWLAGLVAIQYTCTYTLTPLHKHCSSVRCGSGLDQKYVMSGNCNMLNNSKVSPLHFHL